MAKQNSKSVSQYLPYPPVVAVVGHVDHGKTSLLDAIRKSSIAEREHGGITQKIGASNVEVVHEGKKRQITFIDTPGHAAFSKMRSRGASVADIGLLIVSLADGVMPQTRESIAVLQEAACPYIVVLTKADLPNIIIEKVKQQLIKEGVLLEGLGGDVPYISVSARTNLNIKELLDLILLVFDMHKDTYTATDTSPLEAVIIESRLDQKAGPRATAIIKNGTLSVRDEVSYDGLTFKIRSLLDEHGKQVQIVSVGQAVEILGFSVVPDVGAVLSAKNQPQATTGPQDAANPALKRDLVYSVPQKELRFAVVLSADTQGSLEAIMNSLPEEVHIVSHKTGEVSEADILLAKSIGGVVLAFNSKIRPEVQKLAQTEKVLAKNYQIIYELLDEVKDALEGKKLSEMEQIYGQVQIKATFPFDKTTVLGVVVQEGRIARGDKVRLMRGDAEIGETSVNSLRSGKNVVSKVEKGQECGVIISPLLDFRIGDMLISHG